MRALSPGFYIDPDIFRFEQQAVFDRHWWLIGPLSALPEPGDYLMFTLGSKPLFVMRSDDGELRGFHNVCRHRAGPIVRQSRGRVEGKLLVCQYHGWCYDQQGNLRNAHGLNDRINRNDYPLFPVRVESWNGMVFVTLSDTAPTVIDWLGDIIAISERFPPADEMDSHGVVNKSSPVNWKCYADNACEGYHVGLVHKSLDSALGNGEVVIDSYDNGDFVGFDVTYSGSEDDPGRHGKGFWIYKFPGLLLHFSEYSFNAESVVPLAVDAIEVRRWFWVDDERARRFNIDPAKLIESADMVIDEDLGICEAVFNNLSAGVYQDGLVSEEDEPGTVWFQRTVAKALHQYHKHVSA